jgi:hypothetical protein
VKFWGLSTAFKAFSVEGFEPLRNGPVACCFEAATHRTVSRG